MSFEVIPIIHFKRNFISLKKQGRIHGNTVADGWAGAVMRKPLGIKKCDLPTDLPTDTARYRVACPRLEIRISYLSIRDRNILNKPMLCVTKKMDPNSNEC